MLFYFKPPPGHEPVELEALGRTRTFFPQDQMWKKVLVQNDIMPLRDPYDRTKERKNKHGNLVYAKNLVKKYVVDEEQTKALKAHKIQPPVDMHEINEDEWKLLGSGKFAGVAKYFKKALDVEAKQRSSYDTLMREGEKRLAAGQELLAAKEREMAEQIALMDAKMAEMAKKQEQLSAGESSRKPR